MLSYIGKEISELLATSSGPLKGAVAMPKQNVVIVLIYSRGADGNGIYPLLAIPVEVSMQNVGIGCRQRRC